MEDSTFRAYRNNSRFLSSILPLSLELDFILSRIFEQDPRRRINIPELRDLILRCSNFTTRSTGALRPTSPSGPRYASGSGATCHTSAQPLPSFNQYAPSGSAGALSLATYPVMAQSSTSSGGSDHGSIFSATSSCSSTSSCDSYESVFGVPEPIRYTPPQHMGPIFSCSFAFSGTFMKQPFMPSIAAN